MKTVTFLLCFFSFCYAYPQADSTMHVADKEIVHKEKLKRSRVKPSSSFKIDSRITEGSGLIAWNGSLWTHNDSSDSHLYEIDPNNGSVIATYHIPNVKNIDWEEISQDENFIYIGDFGNNSGNSENLKILRVDKLSILKNEPLVDAIVFNWPKTITKGKQEKINLNCEAMVVMSDSIFVFTKEYKKGRRTRVFSIPKLPGNYVANYKSTLKTKVLVTGASFQKDTKQLVLCGYNLWLRPFLLVFPNVNETDFFSGNGKRIKLRKRFRQVEGIATFDGSNYYLINEDFRYLFIHTQQELHTLKIE